MDALWIAVLATSFVWWFSTGAILWRVKSADKAGGAAHRWSVLLAAPFLALGAWGVMATLADETVAGAYIACLSAIAIWGWIEIAFLSGVIAGPNTRPLPAETTESERFIRSWGTIAYHEMLLVAALVVIGWAAWEAPNGFGLWTFIILFFARISAKLNLFFGVPRINTEFLPTPLAHVPSHFRVATLNWVFPISVTALAFAVACWMERIYAAETTADAVGFTLLATLTALALLEHWLMILPLPDERLWRWMMPKQEPIADKSLRGAKQ